MGFTEFLMSEKGAVSTECLKWRQWQITGPLRN